MRRVILAGFGCIVLLATTPAFADSCDGLFYRRNAIYKAKGYCFKTGRAISTFGNEGCQFYNMGEVPLSGRERNIIEDIKNEERALGCGAY